MLRRLSFLLPIIAVIITFSVPAEAQAITIPNCTVAAISCGGGDYYCPNHKGESCKSPSYSVASYDLKQSITAKAATTPAAKKGVTYASKYITKYKYVYVKKTVCTVKNKKKTCVKKKVRTKVAYKVSV